MVNGKNVQWRYIAYLDGKELKEYNFPQMFNTRDVEVKYDARLVGSGNPNFDTHEMIFRFRSLSRYCGRGRR